MKYVLDTNVCIRILKALRAELDIKGTPIGPYDLMIAAITLSSGFTLVTHNVKEFSRIENLKISDWES